MEVKFPFVEILTARQHRSLCLQRYDVVVCGDDEAVRHGGETAKGALATWGELHRGVSRNATERQAVYKIRLRFESQPTPPCRVPEAARS